MNQTIKIYYKNGNVLKQRVHYVHTEWGTLYFTVKQNPSDAITLPVEVPLKNIEKFEVIVNTDDEEEEE